MKIDSSLKLLVKISVAIILQSSIVYSESVPNFNSYDEAVAWYENKDAEMIKPDSTSIYMAKHYEPHKILIVYFQKNKYKGYIHGNFTKTNWIEFKKSPSKGRHYLYYIKGRFRYYLR